MPHGTVAKALDEGELMNSEVHVAGGEEGRATTTGLQVTSDALLLNSELQVAGGGEGRTITMDLQATSEAVLMNLKLPSLQATSEGLPSRPQKALMNWRLMPRANPTRRAGPSRCSGPASSPAGLARPWPLLRLRPSGRPSRT